MQQLHSSLSEPRCAVMALGNEGEYEGIPILYSAIETRLAFPFVQGGSHFAIGLGALPTNCV